MKSMHCARKKTGQKCRAKNLHTIPENGFFSRKKTAFSGIFYQWRLKTHRRGSRAVLSVALLARTSNKTRAVSQANVA